MPNFDAGRYFLTVLAPIRSGHRDGLSFRHALRATLSVLPTALQSPATRKIGQNSPFARNRRTHLARFAVIDDLVFNGAPPIDPLWGRITGRDPIVAGKVDQLSTAYLMFTAEIDAVLQDGDPLPANLTRAQQDEVRDAYATTLWDSMQAELRAIFGDCHGFDGVDDAAAFARFIARAQVETTMPFNDYHTTDVTLPVLPVKVIVAVIAVPLVLLLLSLVGWLAHAHAVPVLSLVMPLRPLPVLGGAALATVAAIYGVYRYIMAMGMRPLPPATDASLPDVLKALHLQSAFTGFAEDMQGRDPAALHAAFGAFLNRHRPLQAEPSQPPGTIPGPIAG